MKSNARFWDRVARRYARVPIKDGASYERKLRETQALLRPEYALLELGCGTGGTAIRHAGFVREVVAVDFSATMLEIGRERARDAGVENLHFEQASLETFDPGERRFDAVLAMSLLHLVEDRDAALRRIAGFLQPGGVFVSSTACLAEHHGFLRYIAPPARALGLFPYFAIFSEQQLRDSIEAAGLRIETAWMQGQKRPHVAFVIARKAGGQRPQQP